MITTFEGWEWQTNSESVLEKCKKKVYIYGVMQKSRLLHKILVENDIEVTGYIVSDNYKHNDFYNGVCVYELSAVKDIATATVVICGGESQHILEENLREKDITDYELFNARKLRAIIPEELKSIVDNANNETLARVRITNKCPSNCKFCGQRNWPIERQNLEMDPLWYFEYMKPLYPKMKALLITGGDAFYARRSYDYLEFLQKEYHHINVVAESDGLSFKRDFQELAVKNLMRLHLSLNASNERVYAKGVWDGDGGEKAFCTKMDHFVSYIRMLHSEEKECFSPAVSMVINKETAIDVIDFAEMALRYGAGSIGYFFDYNENNMEGEYFSDPGIMRPVLITLMEMERLLNKRVRLSFRLWIPLKEIQLAEDKLKDTSDEFLIKKYERLNEYAKDRNVMKEYEKREALRNKYGKRSLSIQEDFSMTLHDRSILKRRVCGLPWDFMDIHPDGRIDVCGWHEKMVNIQDFIEDGSVDWDRVFYSDEFQSCRAQMLQGNYTGCMACCPMNYQNREAHNG